MNDTKSIMIVGVGGQGTLLASRILGHVLLKQGHDLKISEVHGMSQRGGSVVTYVKYGKKVYSPISDKGSSDIIITFEKLEGARWLPYLKKGGTLIMNTQQIDPMPVVIGAASYPEDICKKIEDKDVKIEAIDALSLAENAGSSKATNIVLLGVAAKYMHIPSNDFEEAIDENVKANFIDLNKKAFYLGYNS
ncbi:MAG: iorB [Clostridia bacterium]|jgi:indolepyruvate ferredoxin oxidoreductase beta subunit|nr:iorB [Clostridia bacterium]